MKNYTNILKTLFVFIISTTYVSAQFPEGFETTVPPAGWTTFAGANGLGTAQNWQYLIFQTQELNRPIAGMKTYLVVWLRIG